jgi:O-succinylbenzoate synthase
MGSVLKLEGATGSVGWGEIAPLPGRSQETLSSAIDQLLRWLRGSYRSPLFPSVQFGIEGALKPLALPIAAPLYALLTGTPQEVLKQSKRAQHEGFTTVKLKISSFSIAEAQTVIASLLPHFRLRIDANHAFSHDEALTLFSPFSPEAFDYIEDPTHEIDKLCTFTHPFALDEQIGQFRNFSVKTHPQLKALILKPTLLGGIKGCAPYIQHANEQGQRAVFSPTFETGLGLLQILNVAKAFDRLHEPIGLDTHRHLTIDLLKSDISFNTPFFHLNDAPQIRTSFLTEIAHGTDPLPTF